MNLNGMAANAVASSSAIGEIVAKAIDSRGKSLLLATPVDVARNGRANRAESGLAGSHGQGGSEDLTLATAHCCRSFGDADTHFDYVGMNRPGNIAGRSDPVARGSDVGNNISRTGSHHAASASRQYAGNACGCSGAGAATAQPCATDPENDRHALIAGRRIRQDVAAALPAAIKSSSKNAAGMAALSGRRLHAA